MNTDDQALFKAYPPGDDRLDEPGWIAAELRRLANNIGEARLWAGVHWESDHFAGQKIGRAAAEAVIHKLEQDCIPIADNQSCKDAANEPPPQAIVQPACSAGQDRVPPPPSEAPPRQRGASFLRSHGVF